MFRICKLVDLDMKTNFNGSHFIPSQNSSAFFDVIVNPPSAHVVFYKLNDLHEDKSFVMSTLGNGRTRIAFYHIKSSVTGNYRLNASLESKVVYRDIQITVAKKLVLQVNPPRRAVSKGVSVDLVCTASGWPFPNIQWSTAVGPIPTSKVRHIHLCTYILLP